MVIGVLLTVAPLIFLTSSRPWSLFTFCCLTNFLPFLVSRSLKVSVRPGGTLTTSAANRARLRALADGSVSTAVRRWALNRYTGRLAWLTRQSLPR